MLNIHIYIMVLSIWTTYGELINTNISFYEKERTVDSDKTMAEYRNAIAQRPVDQRPISNITQPPVDQRPISNTTVPSKKKKGSTPKHQHIKHSLLFLSAIYQKKYMTYEEIKHFLELIQEKYKSLVRLKKIGLSYLVELSNNFKDCKRLIFLEPNWNNSIKMGTSLMLHIILEVVQEPSLLVNSDWHIIPVPNVAHYDKPECAVLRRDLNETEDPSRDDLKPTSNGNSCSDGEKLVGYNIIEGLINSYKNRLETYISIQGFGPKILYPSGYNNKILFDWVEMERCALRARDEMLHKGVNFQVSTFPSDQNGKSFGGLVARAKLKLGVPFTYVVQLPKRLNASEWSIDSTITQSYTVIKTLTQCSSRY